MKQSETVDICATIINKTAKAVLISDGIRETWLPISQIEIIDNPDGVTVTIELPEWLALDKELI